MAAGFHNEAVKAEEQLAGRPIDQPRAEMFGIRADHLRVEVRKEVLRGYERPLIFGDAMYLEIPNPRDLHLPFASLRNFQRRSLRRRIPEVDSAQGRVASHFDFATVPLWGRSHRHHPLRLD